MVSALALAGRTHRVWLAVSSILLRINHFVLQEAEITSSDFPVILAPLDVRKSGVAFLTFVSQVLPITA